MEGTAFVLGSHPGGAISLAASVLALCFVAPVAVGLFGHAVSGFSMQADDPVSVHLEEVPELGEFEEFVLLTLLRLGGESYGVPIRDALQSALGREVSFGALYTVLDRLVAKKVLVCRMGEPTAERGGRAKKYFQVQELAVRALDAAESGRSRAAEIRQRLRPELSPVAL